MLRTTAPAALAFCAAVCAALPQTRAAPVDGRLRAAQTAGVVLVERAPGDACHGALVGPRVALTALHCVEDEPATAVVVRTLDASARTRVLRVRSPLRCLDRGGAYDPATDLAVLEMADELPLKPFRTARAADGAQRLTILRGGRASPGDPLAGDTVIHTILADRLEGPLLWSGPVTVPGDSGAPVLDERGGLVALVTGSAPADRPAYSLYLSVAGFADPVPCAVSGSRARDQVR